MSKQSGTPIKARDYLGKNRNWKSFEEKGRRDANQIYKILKKVYEKLSGKD